MKKIISVLLSLALLLSCAAALAETAEKTELGTLNINGEFTLNAAIPKAIPWTPSKTITPRLWWYSAAKTKKNPFSF